MSLPVFDVTRFKVSLPSSGKVIEFRPFLVKEQKQLLMASSAAAAEQAAAINQLIAACTNNAVDAARLPSFDVEYLFLQIRARSVGENIDINLTCGCGEKQNAVLDLTSVKVQHTEGHNKKIDLGNGMLVMMQYPRLQDVDALLENRTADGIIEIIASSIESIWSGDEMFAASDYSREELIAWVNELSPAALDSIETFFASMPVLKHVLDWDCRACGKHNSVALEGMQNFFG